MTEPFKFIPPPQEGEPIRQWVRRCRKEGRITVSDLNKFNWPYVKVEQFTKLGGVSEWLESHVKPDHYVWSCEHFWFTNESDAVMFKLTWVDKANS